MSKTPDNRPPSLCVCMMVRNEASVITRALQSVRAYIDYWVICDTGSTDGTPEIIVSTLQGIQGELHHTPWVNFGHNRTETIRLATGKSDYILVMDADMIVNVKAPFRQKLIEDFYEIRYEGELDYSQAMLVSNRHNWQYVGVTHEYIFAPTAHTWDFLPELTLTHFGDGGCRSEKFERDIELLTKGLEAEPGNHRYMFYLAQSYKDIGQWQPALHWYEKRAATAGWQEEQWYSLYQVAVMKQQLGYAWPLVLSAYLTAFDARPVRLEPVYAIVKHYRETSQYFQGYLYSSFAATELPYPLEDRLFIEKPVYEYLLLLEFTACALACGYLAETIDVANTITQKTVLPLWVYQHAIEARQMAGNRLYQQRNAMVAKQCNRMVLVVPFYNAGLYLQRCVQSILEQDYALFQVVFVDDASTDEGRHFAPPPELDARLIRNTKRRGAAYNLCRVITTCCRPDDIVVFVDGDDWLAGSDALSEISLPYEKYDCWVMYGQYRESGGLPGLSAPFSSPGDFGTLRKHWRTSHIKTFRAGLFQQIAEQDAGYTCFKDRDGKWLVSAVDAAIMFPLLEMAGFDRVCFNEKVLYIYNTSNPLSHNYQDHRQQTANFAWVSSMRPFVQVSQYSSALQTVTAVIMMEE